jgi:hypothetical protein
MPGVVRASVPFIHPKVVTDLTNSLTDAVKAIQGQTDPQAALKALSGMRDPIKYLLRRTNQAPEGDIKPDEIASELEALLFEYQAADDDDEIPF